MSKARQVVLSVEESQREIWVETVKSAADRLVDSIAGSAIESLKEIKACLEIRSSRGGDGFDSLNAMDHRAAKERL